MMSALEVFAQQECSTSTEKEEVQETVTLTTDVPSHLKGAMIIVKLANGKQSEVPAELFKVVPRKQQRLITRVENTQVISCNTKTPATHKKNRVSLVAGYGSGNGARKRITEDSIRLENKVGAVGGVQYQRSLTQRVSVGAQVQSNQTGSLLIGLDF